MPDDFRTLVLAEEGISTVDGDGISQPFKILYAGDFKKRDLKITEADLDKMAVNATAALAAGDDLPVDFDHSFVEGLGSKAAGWYKEVFRKGNALFARVKWTKEAAEQIASGAFKFFSAEFSLDWADENGDTHGPTLLAGALTNRPFLKNLGPVALSEKAQAELRSKVEPLNDLLSDAAAFAESQAPSETRDRVPDEKLTVEIDGESREFSSEEVAALVAKADEKPESLEIEIDGEAKTFSAEEIGKLVAKADDGEDSTKLSEQVQTLTDELASERKTLREERFSAAFSKAQREGRVDAKKETRERWDERLEKFGLDDTVELLNELPAETIPVTERGQSASAGDVVPEEAGVDHEAAKLDREIKALAEEKDITYTEAAVMVGEHEGASA